MPRNLESAIIALLLYWLQSKDSGFFHGIHSKHFGFYRMLADRFPFGIYYLKKEREIQVFAVLDLRRNPLWIRKELSKRKV